MEINSIANEIVLILLRAVADGVTKIGKKTPEEKVKKALEKALDKVAGGNEFWKQYVLRQTDDILMILIRMMDDPKYLESNPLPNYLDEKTIRYFMDCLKEDPEAWDYLERLLNHYVLHEIRTNSQDTLERVRRIDEMLDKTNVSTHYQTLLTLPPMYVDYTNVIGREKDLQNLWSVLENKKYVMLTGPGGIGKTKLAQLLFHTYESEFDEVAWIDYQGELKRSFLDCIVATQFHASRYQNEDEKWLDMKSTLSNDGKKKLFIIDNVDDNSGQHPEQDMELRALTSWQDASVLLISRMEQLDGFEIITLDALEILNDIKVFNHYYSGKAPDPEIVTKIVKLANGNTFAIELLAKGANQENLEDYYNRLINRGFDAIYNEVSSDHQEEKTTIEQHLKVLFDMQKRSNLDKQILSSFAILPVNCECSMDEIEQWFGFKNADLDDVINDGWLSCDENRETYFLHPLVRNIVRFDFGKDANGKNVIAPEGTADKILDYFETHEDACDIDKGFISLQRMINIMESVMGSLVQERSERIATLYKNLGLGYKQMGDYAKALEYYEKELSIKETKLGMDHPKIVTTYNNFAEVYKANGNYDKALEYYCKALKICEKKSDKNRSDTATIYNNIADVYRVKGDYDIALECLEKALVILGEDYPLKAVTYNNKALVYENMGDNTKALEYFEKALAIQETSLGKNDPSTATTYNNIALVYENMGHYYKALEYYEKAMTISESTLGKNHPSTITFYNNIGGAYHHQGKYDKALEYHFKALAIGEKILGMRHPSTAMTYNNIALVYEDMGDFDKAMEYYQKELAVQETKSGEVHPYTISTYNNIARMYEAKGDYDKALEYYEKTLTIIESKLEKDRPSTVSVFNNMAMVYETKGDYAKALEYYKKIREIIESDMEKEHPDAVVTYNKIAVMYYDLGDYDNSLAFFKKTLSVMEAKLGMDYPDIAMVYNNMALVCYAKNDYDSALNYYNKALKMMESKFGKDHPSMAMTYDNIALVYKDKGDYDMALEYFKRALAIQETIFGKDHPSTAMTYNNMAEVYYGLKNFTKAMEFNSKASKIVHAVPLETKEGGV